MRSNPPRLVRTYNNTVNFESSLVGRCLLLPLHFPILSPSSPRPRPSQSTALPSTVSRTILRGSLNRQQFQPLNNSWRSNLTANKLDRISRDLERAPKPRSLSLSIYLSIFLFFSPLRAAVSVAFHNGDQVSTRLLPRVDRLKWD